MAMADSSQKPPSASPPPSPLPSQLPSTPPPQLLPHHFNNAISEVIYGTAPPIAGSTSISLTGENDGTVLFPSSIARPSNRSMEPSPPIYHQADSQCRFLLLPTTTPPTNNSAQSQENSSDCIFIFLYNYLMIQQLALDQINSMNLYKMQPYRI